MPMLGNFSISTRAGTVAVIFSLALTYVHSSRAFCTLALAHSVEMICP